MAPRGARAAVSTPAEREVGALTTAVGPAPDPVGPAGNSADGMAPPVVLAAPPLGESQGLESADAATEAQGAAEANNTEGKTNGNPADHSQWRVRTPIPTARHRYIFAVGRRRSCRVARVTRACAVWGICTRSAVWSLGGL